MTTPLEDWPLTRDYDDLTSAEQQQVHDTMGEESYRAERELHRHLVRQETAPIEPLKATKEKLDAAFKARYAKPAGHNAADTSQIHIDRASSPSAHSTTRSQSSATAQRASTRPAIFSWRTMQVAAASLVVLAMGYSLSFVITPNPKSSPVVREVIRYVDRPVRDVEYRTVYVDRVVKVYEQQPTADTLPVEAVDNLAIYESQGVSLAGDTVMQALMVTLN